MPWTSGLGIQADAQRALDIQKATPGEKAMSEETEIEFETVGSEHWDLVRVDARREASQRIQDRYDLVIEGAKLFETDAGTAITTYITKPPEHISGFGAIFDVVTAACALLLPEEALAAEIVEALKDAYEKAKPGIELVEKANQEVVAKTVEDAQKYLTELTNSYAEEVRRQAQGVKQAAEEAVGAALDSYIKQNPQPLKPGDDELCKNLCDAIGIKQPVKELLPLEVRNASWPPFEKAMLVVAAQIHFFHEMDDDLERLNFLMDEAEKGNDPDALLSLIGADQSYWDAFLTVFRSDGRPAAIVALERHLGLP
jgi:hypothetical protein